MFAVLCRVLCCAACCAVLCCAVSCAVSCAVLCRVLCRLDEYAKRGSEPDSELQIYTWPDATLRELTELIKDVRKDACHRCGNRG
jgi:hypothetical protein